MLPIDSMRAWMKALADGIPTRTRRGAAGKALIVWLASGSLLTAIVAFIIFKLIGC